MRMVDGLSIQESLYPDLTCFGCGHANPDGFHLRSYRDGELTVAEFTPRPEHDNGFGFLNGGIIVDSARLPRSGSRHVGGSATRTGRPRPALRCRSSPRASKSTSSARRRSDRPCGSRPRPIEGRRVRNRGQVGNRGRRQGNEPRMTATWLRLPPSLTPAPRGSSPPGRFSPSMPHSAYAYLEHVPHDANHRPPVAWHECRSATTANVMAPAGQ